MHWPTSLVQIVAGRNVNGRPVRVRKLRPGDPVAGLHVLFIGRADGGRLPKSWLQPEARLCSRSPSRKKGLELGA